MKRLGGDRSTVLCSVPRPKLLSCNLIKGGPAQEVLTWCVTRTRFSSSLIQRSATLLYFREKKKIDRRFIILLGKDDVMPPKGARVNIPNIKSKTRLHLYMQPNRSQM